MFAIFLGFRRQSPANMKFAILCAVIAVASARSVEDVRRPDATHFRLVRVFMLPKLFHVTDSPLLSPIQLLPACIIPAP